MTSAPSFSSFPEFPSSRKEPVAGPSKPTTGTPSFGSFPDLEVGSKAKRRSRSPSRERDDDVKRSKQREERRDRGSDRERDRHRSTRDRDRDRHRDEGRRSKRDVDLQSRHRERSKDRDRERAREKGRDRSAERRYKEARRRRDREAAEALIRGEPDRGESEENPKDSKSEKHSHDKWSRDDDGVAWYESSHKRKEENYQESLDPTSSKAFFSDTVGDRDILRYGSTASSSAPRYRREGKNRILGLPEILRVVYSRNRTEKGLEVAPMGRPYIPRYSARPLESSTGRHLRRILLQPSDSSSTVFDPRSDMVNFDIRPRREVDASEIQAYRSITNEPNTDEEEDDLAALQAAVGSYSTIEDQVSQRTSEMERHLRDQPTDIDTWIQYSNLHLRLTPESERSSLIDSAKLHTTRAQAEVTLSILSRALNAHEDNTSSTKLHLAYLHAAESFWSPDKITARWKNVIRELGEGRNEEEGMMDIWLGYIAWREGQGLGKGGGVDEVVDVYIDCLDKLKSGSIIGNDLQTREENLVYVFLRACLFLKQAGYEERALAAFQALMEITFFKPDHLRYTPDPSTRDAWFSGVLTEFEGFWDDELPRLGENGAKGWRESSTTTVEPPTTQPFKHESSDPYERWIEAEQYADQTYSRPGRATDLDPATEDDPYHIILFDDIQPFLFPIFTPEVRLQLIYAFLTFLGLPFTPPGTPTTASASSDPHLRWNLAHNESLRQSFWPRKYGIKKLSWQTVGGEPMEPERMRGLDNPYQCPIKSWTQERSTLFSKQGNWFRDMETIALGSVDVELVRNVFSLLRPLVPDPAFTMASFAFAAAVSPKSAVKLAKSVLANDRDNLLLWDGYARLERQRGNFEIARTVYLTAIQAAQVSRKDDKKSEDEYDLWAGWAEMEFFEVAQEDKCLEVLVVAAGVGEGQIDDLARPGHVSGGLKAISMLKAKQFYSTLPLPYDGSKLLLASLFAYLSTGVDSAQSLILQHLSILAPSSAEAEEAYQSLVRLLQYHTTRHPSPASLSRATLESALGAFPINTAFLSLYLYGELGGRVYGRIQRLIASLTTSHKNSEEDRGVSVVGQLWSVWAEGVLAHKTFWDKGGGGAERVRMVLDKSINSSSGRQSASLWMLYIEFEIHMERYNTAKQLCYRAVSALGGCKPLYLLPFKPSLRPHFTSRELKDWAEVMLEKGIRLRIPFDQFWSADEEEEKEGGVVELPDDDEVEEDELAFLTERQAMKPY